MKFYKRYISWKNAVTELVDILYLMSTEEDWQHIIDKSEDVKELIKLCQQYNFWQEFEGFILVTKQSKVDGFFQTVEGCIDSWLIKWERYYNHQDNEEFKTWFYKIAYKKLNKSSEEANMIAQFVMYTGNYLHGVSRRFEDIKLQYTKLPPRENILYFERISKRFLKNDIDSPINKYTFDNWLTGETDRMFIKIYLMNGVTVKPLIHSGKWQSFNRWLELYDNDLPVQKFTTIGMSSMNVSYSYSPKVNLLDAVISRIIYNDGDLSEIFKRQSDLYPTSELKKIYVEMERIYTGIIESHWSVLKERIDLAIFNSVDFIKLINNTVDLIDSYLSGQDTELVYPLYKPFKVSQDLVVDAYQSLLRGHREVSHVRSLKKANRSFGPLGPLKDPSDQKPEYLVTSPYIEAELLIKARQYIKQKPAITSTNAAASVVGISLQNDLTDSQILELYQSLMAERYLNTDTKFSDFSFALTESEALDKPIQWLKGNRDLAYLFKQMYGYGMINNREWQSVIQKRYLFINKNGKYLTAQDFAQAIAAYQLKGNPKGSENIEKMLIDIKRLRD